MKRLGKIEPEIKCQAALYVYRDASTNYSTLTNSIMKDSKENGTDILLYTRVTKIKKENRQMDSNTKR